MLNSLTDAKLSWASMKLRSKEKNASKLIPTAKQWAFSADELKNQYKIVFLYDDDDSSPQLKIVLQILKKHAKVYPLQDGLDYVLKAIS